MHYITIREPLTIVPYIRIPIDTSECSSESLVYCRVETLSLRDTGVCSTALIVQEFAYKDQLELGMYTGYLSAYVLPCWALSCFSASG